MAKARTPEELERKRAHAAKIRAIKAEKDKKRNAPVCHPDRKQVGRTGLCHECYIGGSAAQKLTLDDAIKLAKKFADPEEVKELKAKALALLIARLPEYAQLHFEAAKMAALKGDTKPVEWALTTIKELGGTAVLEPPQKEQTPSGTKIIVGVKLSGLSAGDPASNALEAAVVSTDEVTS